MKHGIVTNKCVSIKIFYVHDCSHEQYVLIVKKTSKHLRPNTFCPVLFFFSGGGGAGTKSGVLISGLTSAAGTVDTDGVVAVSPVTLAKTVPVAADTVEGTGARVAATELGALATTGVGAMDALSRPRSDLTKLLSTSSSSNFFLLMERVELRLFCCCMLTTAGLMAMACCMGGTTPAGTPGIPATKNIYKSRMVKFDFYVNKV